MVSSVKEAREEFLAADFQVRVHHYVATSDATTRVVEREAQIRSARSGVWFPAVTFSFGAVLPADIKLAPSNSGEFGHIVEKHYNKKIETDSTRVGGTEDIKYGYGYCGCTYSRT